LFSRILGQDFRQLVIKGKFDFNLDRFSDEVFLSSGLFNIKFGRFALGSSQPAGAELGSTKVTSYYYQDIGQVMARDNIANWTTCRP